MDFYEDDPARRPAPPNTPDPPREVGAKAEPIVAGAYRELEVVVILYERYVTRMDDLDNLAIQALYRERVEGNDRIAGRSLEYAARELGFDPDELFAASDGSVQHCGGSSG